MYGDFDTFDGSEGMGLVASDADLQRALDAFNLAAAGSVFLYGKPDALYGSAKYGNQSGPSDYKISLGRTGKTIKLKMVTEVNGNYSSLINTTLLTKQGKIR